MSRIEILGAAIVKSVRMARFKPGDRVRVLSPADSIYVGADGIVEDVILNTRGITVLDSYRLVFAWGEKADVLGRSA